MNINQNPYIAQLLLESQAVQINSKELFTFSSGIKSPIYCDNRILIGIPQARKVIIDQFTKNCQNDINNIDVIVGTATAGIPWAAFIAQILDKPMAYIRGSQKSHGTSKLIEGASLSDKNVLIIEDLITTGGSVIQASKVALEQSPKSISLQAIFSYGFSKTKDTFAKESLSFNTLTNLDELLKVGKEKEYLTQDDIDCVLNWKKNKDN